MNWWKRLQSIVPEYPLKVDLVDFYTGYFSGWPEKVRIMGTRFNGEIWILRHSYEEEDILVNETMLIVRARGLTSGLLDHQFSPDMHHLFDEEHMENML